MLKFIYTDAPLYLELLNVELADWVKQRQMFAASMGEFLSTTAERATFLVPDLICEVTAINFYLHQEGVKNVTVHRCDFDQLEITLTGYWLSTDVDSTYADNAEGIFITQLPDRVESYLWQLWHTAHNRLLDRDEAIG
jgi:hypothetical protein